MYTLVLVAFDSLGIEDSHYPRQRKKKITMTKHQIEEIIWILFMLCSWYPTPSKVLCPNAVVSYPYVVVTAKNMRKKNN